MSRCFSQHTIALLAAAALIAPTARAQESPKVDVLLRHGTVVDGTGAPARQADVGIRGERIVFVGNAATAGLRATRTVEARGLIVSPGFIDPHTHTLEDLSNARRRGNAPYLMQGVTTVVTNNDGGGAIAIGATLDEWTRGGIGTNGALYVPQGAVRRSVMGMSDAAPTPAQLDSMRAIVARGMRDGALGLSTGLYYAPGSYAKTGEVVALAKVAAEQGGIYDSHMRDESSYTIGLIGSINETLQIAREANIPVHISHIKALGADVWGQSDTVIALIRAARAAGVRVTADEYPYLASGTSVGASLLPRWAEAGGRDSLRARVGDPAIRPRLVSEMERNLVRRGGAASLLITSTRDSTIRGRTLAQVAEARHQTPIDAALAIVLAGDASVASFNMKPADLERFMTEPWVMTGSDGSDGHPRKYGTFPRKLREYVLDRKVLTLPQAIHVSSQLTAQTLQLPERGVIAAGNFADVIVFDSATIRDRSTYVEPELLATGMRYVLVNGQFAVDKGTATGILAGRALRRSGSASTGASSGGRPSVLRSPVDYASRVEVRRTTHGVPHIKADDLAAAEYALAYVQSEDYGARVPLDLLRSRGEMGRWFGRDSSERDFAARVAYERAVATYPFLEKDTRDVYEGFAAGANRYVELHPEAFPAKFDPHFTGYDVLAHDVSIATATQAAKFLARNDPSFRARRAQPAVSAPSEGAPEGGGSWVDTPDEGSNAWAFGPSRTKSKHAILLRNPHLQWNAGYYEAHITVPGKLDYYGDFRIGGPFGVVGGFNRNLGWSTTNNDPLLEQVYALPLDSAHADQYLLDGISHPIDRQRVTVEFRDGAAMRTETREVPRTPFGPIVYRDSAAIYVLRAAMDGDYRAGEQFLHMMRAGSLAEWKDAMRMQARLNSSFTYADRAGNVFYVWNAAIPSLPQGQGNDTTAVRVRGVADIWTHYVPFDSLPQVLNPKGGYIHNENDPPYFTNMRQPLDRAAYPAYFPEPRLGLRSQMALKLVDTDHKLSLTDVLALKHSYHMLLSDRVRDDLVSAVRASHPAPDVAHAIDAIARWDGTVAPTSRGGVLFEIWWRRYIAGARADTMYAEPWSAAAPTTTPRGLHVPARAVDAFAWATQETTRRYGSADVAWGDVHRVRVGNVDVPVGGCNGDIGCFRVLWYKDDPDGKREAVGGDGWILAVEFGDQPRAFSVLAYGESPDPASPFHSDQAQMFARGELKPVAWSEADIAKATVRRYRPGMRP
jgi:acyl-homoserine-lactone acylase